MMPVNFSTCCLIPVLCLLLHLLLPSVAQDETCYEKANGESEGFTNDITVNIVCLQNGSIDIGWKFDALQYSFFQVEYQCNNESDIDDDIDWGNNIVLGEVLISMDVANVTIVLFDSDYRYCVVTGCAYQLERGIYKHYYIQPSYCMASHGNSILDEQSSAMMSSSVVSVAIVSSAFLASIGGSSSSTSTVPITSHMHTATLHSLTDEQSSVMMSVTVASSASTRASSSVSSTVAITSSATHIHTASHSPTVNTTSITISTSIAAGPAPSVIMPESLIISVAIITVLLFISLVVILSLCLRFRKRCRCCE